MFKKTFFLFMLSMIPLFSQTSSMLEEYHEVLSEVLMHADYCVKKQTEDKIYIQAKSIQVTENGLYIDLNERRPLAVDFLYADEEGCYIPTADCFWIGPDVPIYCPKMSLLACLATLFNYRELKERFI